MSKRKPPSQRAERQLDDTARAIAKMQETAKDEKSADAKRRSDETKPSSSNLAKQNFSRAITGPAPMPSTKRPKKV